MRRVLLETWRIGGAGALVFALIVTPVNADTFQVCADGSGDYLTIQEAIDVARNGDEVIVCDGVFTGTGNRDLDFGGLAITVRSLNGPNNCIIDCGGSYGEHHRGFYFHSYETADAIVDGLTICNGHTDAGGAVYCVSNSNPTLVNCVITGNVVEDYGTGGTGGGICCIGSGATIVSCTIEANSAASGGGIYSYEGDVVIVDCIIAGNDAEYGGGVYCWDYTPSISGCTITGNTAGNTGGGCCCVYANAAITNSVISENVSTASAGGAFYLFHSSPTFVNCTIASNRATVGGALRCYSSSSPTITNCILWNDTPDELSVHSGTPVVTYSDVQGGWTGVGNVDADPEFVAGHYLAQIAAGQAEDSPCVDAGDPAGGPIEGTTRTDGVQDADRVDMGYHYSDSAACPADMDGDCDVDLEDFHLFAECLTGPEDEPAGGCEEADLDFDGDVDLEDFAAFQGYFGGGGI